MPNKPGQGRRTRPAPPNTRSGGGDADERDVPRGFQSADEPAAPGREPGASHAAQPRVPETSWDMDDPQRRKPGLEADRLGAGFDPTHVGDETGDAASPRPDPNVADEIGDETGVPVQENEELAGSVNKLAGRDEHRWELNPASSEDYPERVSDEKREHWDEGEDLPPL